MATIDLGKISFTQKGTWASGTTYEAKDVVQYTDDNETSSYVAIASSTNQAPSTNGTVNTSYWQLFAKGATIGSTNEGVWNIATAYQKNAVVQYTDSGTVSTFLAVADSTGQTPSTGGTVNSTYWQLIAKGTDAVAVSWDNTPKTANFTAQANSGYFVDTTSSAVTVTTPSSPNIGDEFIVIDYAGKFGTNLCSIDSGAENIKGQTASALSLDENYGSVRIVYTGSSQGWIPVSSSNVTNVPLFNGYQVEYLVVAGGGGGGGDNGGGGGAGGYRANNSKNFSLERGNTYTVTVGSGGLGGFNDPTGAPTPNSGGSLAANGTDSVFASITASGGGGGGSASTTGADGGSGGGGSQGGGGGSGNTPSTSPSQGNDGGSSSAGDSGGAGGGGAGGAGASTGGEGVNGGVGVQNDITGTNVYYAGGGGGGERQSDNGVAGTGGAGGGGNGSTAASGRGNQGTDGLGGGGGGGGQAGNMVGGTGGSGVVIIRMATSDYSGTTTGSPTVTTDGSDTIIKWTSSGSYTA